MDILGIGPLELLFIILIALIILGPKDMIKAGRTTGSFLRKIVTSPNWKILQQASRDMRYLPNRLMKEAGLDDLKDQIPAPEQIQKEAGLDHLEKEMKDLKSSISEWTTPPDTIEIENNKEAKQTSISEENNTNPDND